MNGQGLTRARNAAFAKARKLWGKNAAIDYRPTLAGLEAERAVVRTIYAGLPWPRSLYYLTCRPCVVGVITMGLFFEVRGEGDTWAEAFEAAAARATSAAASRPAASRRRSGRQSNRSQCG